MEEARSLVVTAYLVERPVDVGVIGVPLDRCSIGGCVSTLFGRIDGFMDGLEREGRHGGVVRVLGWYPR